MDGFINLLKPPGMTSSDAVVYVRKRLPRGTKVGHAGTLDPEAAGVLPVMVGRAPAQVFQLMYSHRARLWRDLAARAGYVAHLAAAHFQRAECAGHLHYAAPELA